MPLTKRQIDAAASIRIRHILDDVEPEPEPEEPSRILREDDGFILREDGSKFLRE